MVVALGLAAAPASAQQDPGNSDQSTTGLSHGDSPVGPVATVPPVPAPSRAHAGEFESTISADPDGESSSGRLSYPGDPESEAGYVAAEDDRLVEVRTVDSLAQFTESSLNVPYRLATGSAYTLVLTPRSEAYTVADLLALAPQTFLRQPDGEYLLSEHIVIQAGATLNLSSAGGLKLLLASDAEGFVSIVNFGGRLNIIGASGAPVTISSYDRESGGADLLTDDGRAYLRSIGGQVMLSHVEMSNLGFWSGRTGGLSLTGTERPNSGLLDELGETMRVGKRAARERAAAEAQAPTGPQDPSLDGRGRSTLSQVVPTGPLPVPTVDIESPQYSFVSVSITDTHVTGNAFGVFVSGANGVDIRNSSFDDNLVDGMVMHRYVVNAVVEATSADGNGGDGFLLARATTGIVLSEVTAQANYRNGMTLSGLPLAEGPSATGTSIGSYGNNSVANSQMNDNGRYGVEVIGGVNIGILSNNIDRNEFGVVVREGAQKVSVVGNRVGDSARQGIAVRDAVEDTVVSGNIVTGGETSVYLRDTQTLVQRNTLTDASLHAVSLVGRLSTTMLTENTIAGRGPSAIDFKRAVDLDKRAWRSNDTGGWDDTTPFLITLKRFLQPLTLMWIILGSLLLFTAVRGARGRARRAHPYEDKLPVTDGRLSAPPPLEKVGG
jgi:hypothetical protein